jgi:hypothetical protein
LTLWHNEVGPDGTHAREECASLAHFDGVL